MADAVLGHLRPGDENRPRPRPVLAIGPQKTTHILVDSLHLPVTLGVKPEVRLTENPRRSINALQTLDVNWGPRAETISSGTHAVCSAVGSPGKGRRWQDLENRSTTTRIVVLPCEGGSSVRKSTERCHHVRCGTGRGCNFPLGRCLGALHRVHTEQEDT